VLVEAPASLALLLLSGRQTAHVAPVIIAQEHGDIVGHSQTCVIVVLYLFI
jgi:hypothetical protein